MCRLSSRYSTDASLHSAMLSAAPTARKTVFSFARVAGCGPSWFQRGNSIPVQGSAALVFDQARKPLLEGHVCMMLAVDVRTLARRNALSKLRFPTRTFILPVQTVLME
ncbi:hypothetical protein MRB53_040195 [Persea americana]|nr:hypothetical protein MRB53_040195 [Persea americana]